MPTAVANGHELAYEVTGSGPPLLLVMGLGGQLTDWHPGFVEELSEFFRVIRFDNRDSGLSTYSAAPSPSRWELIKGNLAPGSVTPPYSLDDMADDAAALLEALDIQAAHVAGMSMGGMIAQSLTMRHSARVLSLCSIMSSTGNRFVGRPTTRVIWSMARRGEPDQADALDITLDFFRLCGGADWDEEEQRRRTSLSLARAYNPAGVLRQAQAIAAAPDRTDGLRSIVQPTVVIHGFDDTLVRPSGGIATAKAIDSSRLLLFPQMGHDIPATRHGEIVQAIRANAHRANAIFGEA